MKQIINNGGAQAVKNKQELSPFKKKRINSRAKGHAAEQKYARIFRDAGFRHCKTSREASRMLDDCKVDLAFLPVCVQIKKGYERVRPKPDKIFKEMKKMLGDNFPEDDAIHQKPKVLIHEIDGRCEENCLVTMTWKEWFTMFLASQDKQSTNGDGNDGEGV